MITSRALDPAPHLAPGPRRKPGSAPQCHDAHYRLFTTAAHRGTSPPTLHRCRLAVSQATSYTFDQAKIAPSTAAATTILALRSSIRRQLRRPAHPLPKPPPRQIPINGNRPHGPPRVPSWGAFGRRPSLRADRSPQAGIRNPSPKLPFQGHGSRSTGRLLAIIALAPTLREIEEVHDKTALFNRV